MIFETVFADQRGLAAECGTVLLSDPTAPVCFWGPAVYGLCDPREPRRIRYVGQTESPPQRYESHCYPTTGGAALLQWLRTLRADGVYPVMLLLVEASVPQKRLGMETHWICRLKRRGMADLNRAPVRHSMWIGPVEGASA